MKSIWKLLLGPPRNLFVGISLFLCGHQVFAGAGRRSGTLSIYGGIGSRVETVDGLNNLYQGLALGGMYLFGSGNVNFGFGYQTAAFQSNYEDVDPPSAPQSIYSLPMRIYIAGKPYAYVQGAALLARTNGLTSFGFAGTGGFRVRFGVGAWVGVSGTYTVLRGSGSLEYTTLPALTFDLDI